MLEMEKILEEFSRQTLGVFAFSIAMFVSIIFAVLGTRAPWMLFSIFRVVGKVLIAPVRYTMVSFRDAADIGKGVAFIAPRDRTSLVRVVLFTLRVLGAVAIAWHFAVVSSLAFSAFFPPDYVTERIAELDKEREEAETAAREAAAEWSAYQESRGEKASETPELLSLRKQLTTAKQKLQEAVATYQEELSKYETADEEFQADENAFEEEQDTPSLPMLVNRLAQFLADREPESKSDRRMARKATQSELCDSYELPKKQCKKLLRVVSKWGAMGSAKTEVDNLEAKLNPLEEQSAVEMQRKQDLKRLAERTTVTLNTVAARLEETKLEAGIQFKTGFSAIGVGGLMLWCFVWILGLVLESIQLGFRWMDDVGEIRAALSKHPRNTFESDFQRTDDFGVQLNEDISSLDVPLSDSDDPLS